MKHWWKTKLSSHFKGSLIGIAVAGTIAFACIPRPALGPEEIGRGKLERLIADNAIVSAEVTPRMYNGIYTVKGTYSRVRDSVKVDFIVTTHLSDTAVEALLARSTAAVAVPKINTPSKVMDIVPTLVVAALVIGLVVYQVNFGRGRRTHRVRHRPDIRFADVAGIEESKAEVQEVVEFLRDPGKFSKLGGKLPKGVLLIGPPGTGKTMLARAIAGEANANFFSASGSDFNEVYVGVGAKRIREIFRQAQKHRPAIIFIDEIDCLGKHRRLDNNGEMQQTNNALLTAMDGFEASDGVIVIAATNRPEDLDAALLRPGRFDRKVYVPLPDARGRRAILETHGRRTPMRAAESALDLIAQTTPGMSGADLANLINEAAILSARKNQNEISVTELEEARDKVRFGDERKSMVLKDDERRIVAYHEAGHAICYVNKPLLPPLHKVSIIPRGQALGTTTVLPREDQNIHGRQFLLQQLAVLMGGRAAEAVFCGDISNGANGDLDSAKNIARKMIHDWGMGKRLYYEPEKADAEHEINELLTEAYDEALAIIRTHRIATERLAEALLTEETVTREQVMEIVGGCPLDKELALAM